VLIAHIIVDSLMLHVNGTAYYIVNRELQLRSGFLNDIIFHYYYYYIFGPQPPCVSTDYSIIYSLFSIALIS
jgi:hypothetical protein